MIKVILVIGLCCHVAFASNEDDSTPPSSTSAPPTESTGGADTPVKTKPECAFKPEICKSEVSACNNVIRVESDLNLRTTETFWRELRHKVLSSVIDAIDKKCRKCCGKRDDYGSNKDDKEPNVQSMGSSKPSSTIKTSYGLGRSPPTKA